ncbi:MAG TPA: DUF3570 domain-containing protein [Polyangiaceae bacterium]
MQLIRTLLQRTRFASLLLAGLGSTLPARAQVGQADVRTTILYEPSKESHLLVFNPAVDLAVQPVEWLDVHAAYEADIVTGATEALKSGPVADITSGATDFHDTRHHVGGGLGLIRKDTRLSVDYSYGTESDYRSHGLSVGASTDFFQKNTEIALSYGRGFDEVCTSAYTPSTDPSQRTRLDSSEGCFTGAANRASRDVDIDNFQAAWTQAWTPVIATQAVLTASLQHGFLENPYRGVVIASAGQEALENHPDNRARGAVSLRGKYFWRGFQTAFSGGVRLYRDTWDIFGQTYELEAEKYLTQGLRVLVHGRYYNQSGALFWSDDYTGGEPVSGPRGQYWTGDREVSPLSSWMVGGRVLLATQGAPTNRVLGFLLRFQVTGAFDLLKTNLREFTWGGDEPTDDTSLLMSLAVRGEF